MAPANFRVVMHVAAYPEVVSARRLVIGAVTSLLALLALTAMHVLPAVAQDAPPLMAGMVHAVGAPASAVHVDGASAAMQPDTGATHDAGGAPWHGHSLVHLCLAVLAVGLTLMLARSRHPASGALMSWPRLVVRRPLFVHEIGPPGLASLCVVRC